jgi:hypothetical protein
MDSKYFAIEVKGCVYGKMAFSFGLSVLKA